MPSTAKTAGAVYTPPHIADAILDQAGLTDADTLACATVCEPSCGDGALLWPLAYRVLSSLPQQQAASTLRRITAFDIDAQAVQSCIDRLNLLVGHFHPRLRIPWNISVADATLPQTTRPIMGSFSHVVGNPPYVRIQNIADRDRIAKQFHTIEGATDLYIAFFELGIKLLRKGGTLSYITPNGWLSANSARTLRAWLTAQHRVDSIVDHRHKSIFHGVNAYTAITTITKDASPAPIPVTISDGEHSTPAGLIHLDETNRTAPWSPLTEQQRRRLQQLQASGVPLRTIADIIIGLQTGADHVFIQPAEAFSHLEPQALRPIIRGAALHRGPDPVDRRVIYPYSTTGALLREEEFLARFPQAHQHLSQHRDELLARDRGQFPKHQWYSFGRNTAVTSSFGDKIITPTISPRPNFSRHNRPDAAFHAGYAVKPRFGIDPDSLLEPLNSDDMDFFINITGKPLASGWMSYAKSYIQDFPIPREILPKHAFPQPIF